VFIAPQVRTSLAIRRPDRGTSRFADWSGRKPKREGTSTGDASEVQRCSPEEDAGGSAGQVGENQGESASANNTAARGPEKCKLSAAARKTIIAAMKKRWAARRKLCSDLVPNVFQI